MSGDATLSGLTESTRSVDPPFDFPDPTAESVVYEPSFEELRAFSEPLETTTEYGSASYVSEFRSRSSDRTKNAVDDTFTEADWRLVDRALTTAETTDLVCLDRMVGRHSEHAYCCRLFVPKEYGRIALAWAKLLDPAPEGREPDFYTLQLPDAEETAIRVLPEEGATVVLGSDYTGEAKKSFLRLFMYRAKQRGGLGLHAGSKRLTLETDDGELSEVHQAFLGLSGTGKSTLTGHGCWLDSPESAVMLQDDVCALFPDALAGSEGGGLYIKTIGLDEAEQPALHHAVTQPKAILENVSVDADGTVDFDDGSLTTNGRAVIRRDDLPSAAPEIDCERADQVFFITRNPLMPPAARLTPEQAAVAFMLGESVETSAGDPERAGESIRVVGTNPFIVGPEGEEGNRFADLMGETDAECFVLNTGSVGSKGIGVEDTIAILTAAARGGIEWTYDDRLGFEVPERVPGMEIREFRPEENIADYESKLAALREERREYLAGFDTLREGIREAVY
ncbi:phosphoenolpyruvate carboxykinase (ATP) [Halalkalicoccus jeotgali]|uniref:phosphoenolpyruvate carboxykinase (ATP) n=1 Tax=Halalkalicoccus jeotgali (strain DSM 18796 / CECT 7217 / JCM 14584 / KCTC 4019 / B3) TaxID=795797 RepID=D8J367_HALJB|nr:phosphoenolpyruvate carboxykinase (ATP) [Halalkalicoccus jeotgali]ADJ15174.1 phosphoenolpyruvate carboxykinase [Halalkalicoccus jeotgali B3]ELY35106.1 phosphoenolpyruvate carboxykinase [Halalkalicoccus jeotgali B3]